MIFRGFKRKTNQIFFNKRLREFNASSQHKSSKKITKILVLLDDVTLKESIENDLKQQLHVDEFYIHTLIYHPRMKSDGTFNDWIHPGDFGWFGKINSARIRKILTNRFDLLINYCRVDNLYQNIILLQSKSEFRAGFPHLNQNHYDIVINCKSGDWKTFNAELTRYLAILNKIRN